MSIRTFYNTLSTAHSLYNATGYLASANVVHEVMSAFMTARASLSATITSVESAVAQEKHTSLIETGTATISVANADRYEKSLNTSMTSLMTIADPMLKHLAGVTTLLLSPSAITTALAASKTIPLEAAALVEIIPEVSQILAPMSAALAIASPLEALAAAAGIVAGQLGLNISQMIFTLTQVQQKLQSAFNTMSQISNALKTNIPILADTDELFLAISTLTYEPPNLPRIQELHDVITAYETSVNSVFASINAIFSNQVIQLVLNTINNPSLNTVANGASAVMSDSYSK